MWKLQRHIIAIDVKYKVLSVPELQVRIRKREKWDYA